jgi:succinyl-diaminopimelate desuccinylase
MFDNASVQRVLSAVDASRDEMVDFARALIRVPTINPPGDAYEPCARLLGDRLGRFGFEVEYHAAEGRPEHTSSYPRVNVVGIRGGRARRPMVHLNGHLDVVPAGRPIPLPAWCRTAGSTGAARAT